MLDELSDPLTLHGYFRSSAAYRVRIALNLKSLAYNDVGVHLVRNGGEQHTPEYRRLNPLGLVPVLEAGDFELGQSILDLKLLSVMCVPLRVKDRMTGLLYVDSKASSKEFSDRDLTLFKALAGQVASAIDNARLLQHYVEKQRMSEELHVAQQIQQSLLPRGGLQAPGLDIAGLSVPCEETSGDYFDYIRRDAAGRIKESDDVSRSLSQDRRRKAKTAAKSGQGDRGDRKTASKTTSRKKSSAKR